MKGLKKRAFQKVGGREEKEKPGWKILVANPKNAGQGDDQEREKGEHFNPGEKTGGN